MAPGNRHSTIVTWSKVILPLLGILLLSSLFLFSRNPDPQAAIPFSDVDVAQIARDQRLSRPRFASTLRDGREVTLVAETAQPDPEETNLIRLDRIEARIDMMAQDYLLLNADNGEVNTAEQTSILRGNVQALSSRGYRINSAEMQVSLDESRLVSPGDVVITGPGLNLSAGAMEFVGPEGMAVLSFTNGVRLLYVQQN